MKFKGRSRRKLTSRTMVSQSLTIKWSKPQSNRMLQEKKAVALIKTQISTPKIKRSSVGASNYGRKINLVDNFKSPRLDDNNSYKNEYGLLQRTQESESNLGKSLLSNTTKRRKYVKHSTSENYQGCTGGSSTPALVTP